MASIWLTWPHERITLLLDEWSDVVTIALCCSFSGGEACACASMVCGACAHARVQSTLSCLTHAPSCASTRVRGARERREGFAVVSGADTYRYVIREVISPRSVVVSCISPISGSFCESFGHSRYIWVKKIGRLSEVRALEARGCANAAPAAMPPPTEAREGCSGLVGEACARQLDGGVDGRRPPYRRR